MKLQAVIVILVVVLGATASAQEGALPRLREAAKANPGQLSAQLALGKGLVEAGRYKEADGHYKRLAKRHPDSPEVLFEAVGVDLAQDDYRRGRAACAKLQRAHPDHVLGHVCMARAFLTWRRSSRAFEHIDKAVATDPKNIEAQLTRADALRIQGRFDEAAKAYKALLAADAGHADAHLGLGLLARVQNRKSEAVAELRKALERAPEDPDVQLELGRALLDSGDAKGAVEQLSRAQTGRRDFGAPALELHIAQLQVGDAAAAEAGLARFLKEHPKHPVATAHYGSALVTLGRADEAERILSEALSLAPHDFDTALALAKLYEATGRAEQAFTQYRSAADLDVRNAAPLIAAARLGLALKRPLLSGALLDKALSRAPDSAEALALYGDALSARGEKKAARDYYQKALKGQGELDRAAVRKRIDALR
ncbi:MAG: tetratricopeptide repeat protein [Myxococcales bacterium]|nr:tetratricopeptide repeat protein [Myxococcales bacterium]